MRCPWGPGLRRTDRPSTMVSTTVSGRISAADAAVGCADASGLAACVTDGVTDGVGSPELGAAVGDSATGELEVTVVDWHAVTRTPRRTMPLSGRFTRGTVGMALCGVTAVSRATDV